MAEEAGLNRDIASSLLYLPSKTTLTEEKQRPWSINHFQPFQKPFLKTWDRCSGSQPDDEHRMLSRAPRQRLDTLESRKSSLTTHIDHSKWNPTPYISFTTSPAALKKMANWRASQRGPQTLTVLDPNARMADGLPILDVLAEMDHYGIKNPYKKLNQYYKDHYLCLWEVTGREIIGHWEWADLVANEQWYHEIILPAFREHTKSRSLEEETPGLSAAMNKLSLICDPSDPKHLFYNDSNTSSEKVTCYFDGGFGWSDDTDTDDEAEEANAADDMIKMIEGDWYY